MYNSKNYDPIEAGDALAIYASIVNLQEIARFKPDNPTQYGLQKFVDWYVGDYNLK